MYRFEDTIKRQLNNPLLPTSAMNYDGLFFEEAIEGYRTLYVEGREMISPNIQYNAVKRGSKAISQSLPSRVLTVHYKIENKDSYRIMTAYRELMYYLLRDTDVEIYFRDELDAVYFGRFSASDEVPGNTYSFVSSFEITCSDPYKYSQKLHTTDKEILRPILFDTTPEYIKVTGVKSGDMIVTNGQHYLTLKSLTASSNVTIDFKQGKVFINGANRTSKLGLADDFENFYIKQGQQITTNNGVLEIGYREVWL